MDGSGFRKLMSREIHGKLNETVIIYRREMTAMKVGIINNANELESLEPFEVGCLLWGTEKIPKTYGYLGFVPGDGFYLKMICMEKDPLRTYDKDQSPVYRDSAMEAFFMFEPAQQKEREEQNIYINLEMNANGALLAGYGSQRVYRSYFAEEERGKLQRGVEIEEDRWSISLRLPLDILEKLYGHVGLKEGSTFFCNFYKISETKEIEHYASYSPIRSDIPSFHLPEYFAQAEIVVKNK